MTRDQVMLRLALLPKITTVAEMEALPDNAKMIDGRGDVWKVYWARTSPPFRMARSLDGGCLSFANLLRREKSLTLVWLPA